MKILATLLFCMMTLSLAAASSQEEPSLSARHSQPRRPIESPVIPWAYLSAASGVVGLILAFVPYLSLLGILLGAAAVVFSLLAFRKKQRKRWAWLGMITGGLTVLAFVGVLGLLAFF